MEIGINRGLNTPLGERELPHALNFVADADTAAAEDALVAISLEKRGDVIERGCGPFPGIEGFLHSVFVNEGLELAISLLFTPGADHRMVKQDQLKLKPSRIENLRGPGDDFHSFFRRSKTGRQKLGFSLLLDDAEATRAEGNEPPVMTEGGDANAGRLSGFENRRAFGDLNLSTIDS
jgi:hypothetical protein